MFVISSGILIYLKYEIGIIIFKWFLNLIFLVVFKCVFMLCVILVKYLNSNFFCRLIFVSINYIVVNNG